MRPISEAAEPQRRFVDIELQIHYEGSGEEILVRFVLPVLQAAVNYDRLTSFFSVNSLLAIAQGVEGLWRRQGTMRLILGIHDVPAELAQAATDDFPELVLDAVRQRLLDQVSTLRDELSRDRLATLAWMMQDGLLQVRVATPLSVHSNAVPGVFHSKRFIFKDAAGDMISAVGSPNETLLGLGANFEEIDVHMSWQDPLGYARTHAESFERIWAGEHEGLRVVELDKTFAIELLARLGNPARPPIPGVQAPPRPLSPAQVLLSLARRSPAWAPFNLTSAALYPHQERVFMDALGRWPVRVLLADEVGLGKTLEAGMVIAYAVRFLGVRRVAVLAPAGLLRQWQDEMQVHFDLDFWRYDSGSRAFLSPSGDVRTVPRGIGPIGAHSPDLVLISSQLARGNRKTGHALSGVTTLPDMLVVDEAHAARVRVDTDGVARPTLMWRLLDDVKDGIPHLVFLSATPMQLDSLEYHSMLELLGLPEWWSDRARLDEILRLLSSPSSVPALEGVKHALAGISATMRQMRPDLDRLGASTAERALLHELADTAELGAGRVVDAQGHWDEVYSTLVKTHPGHLLTIRNTRRALMGLGYSFPERNFLAPPLTIDEAIADFYSMVDAYLDTAFGRVEAAQHPERANALGFMRSTYRQRLASSLRAAERTLARRSVKLERLLEGAALPDGEDEEEFDDSDEDFGAPGSDGPTGGASVEQACRAELGYLHDLVRKLEDIDVEDLGQDPKLDVLVDLIGQHLVRGDQMLVFSRYTDTVEACVELFLDRQDASEPPPHAKYTGDESWMDNGRGPLPVTKEEIRRALDEGEIHVVFCSDAASEGLNLQAARVIINVDVPWNPARLEQRIGRIARLGQTAPEVDIYNLWYPDSVEARIYERLLQRRDLYELAVGEFPEIVGTAIRDELASRFERGVAAISDDPIEVLQELREDQQRLALQRIWRLDLSDRPESQRFRERLADLVVRVDPEGLRPSSVLPGDRNPLTLGHPVLDEVASTSARTSLERPPIRVVLQGSVPIGFVLEEANDFIVVPAEDFPTLLAWLAFGEKPVGDLGWARVARASTDQLLEAVAAASIWTPDPRELTCVVPAFGERAGLRPAGDVSVADLYAVAT
jgi:superfamily II DNA or RNA helicase